MIVVRFKVTSTPERAEQVAAALRAVVAPSRALDGVVHFDVGRDVTDPNSFIATEVFDSTDALDAQEALPEVAAAMGVFADSLAAEPEATVFEVSSSRPWE